MHFSAYRTEMSKTILLEPSSLSAALTDLWHQRLLCDIVLRTTTTTNNNNNTSTIATTSNTTSDLAVSYAGRSQTDGSGPGPGLGPPAPLRQAVNKPTAALHDPQRPSLLTDHMGSCRRSSPAGAYADACDSGDADEYGDGDGEGEGEAMEGASVQAVAGAGDGGGGGGPGGGGAGKGDGASAAGTAAAAAEDLGEVEDLPAHRVVLAATCDYFRALMTGAGAAMSDMRAAAAAGAAAAAAAACGGGSGGGGGYAAACPPAQPGSVTAAAAAAGYPAMAVVVLPGLDGWALRLAVGALYERRVEVAADNLEGLISAASYLGAGALLDACAAFMRSNLGLQTCLPLLLLAWRYNMGPLREELMSYVCRRFSVLVRTRLSSDGAAATASELRLSSLPLELLAEVLRSEELVAECESDVLQCAMEWLAEQHCAADHPLGSSSSSRSRPACIGSSDDSGGAVARELVRLVHWAALPDPPHLHLTRGSPSAQVRALAALLEAHELETHVTHGSAAGPAAGAAGGACAPPAVLRLRWLLAELQATTVLTSDLAPYGPGDAAAAPPPQATATAGRSINVSGGLGEALRRVGPVVPSCGGGGGRPRRHLASCLLAAGGHDASWRAVKAVEMYDPRTDQWVAGPSLLQGLSFTGSAMVPGPGSGFGFGSRAPLAGYCGAVFLVGGTPLCSSVWRLPWGADGPVGRGWEPCPPLLMPRAHAGVVAVAGTLTVLGGRSQVQQVQHVLNTVEVLNPGAGADADAAAASASSSSSAFPPPGGCWQRGPDMVLPRSAHACAVLGGRVFALGGAGGVGGGAAVAAAAAAGRGGGGAGGGGGATHRSGEFLDLGSGRWQLLGCDMATERKYMAAASHGGRIYVAGGVNDSRTRLSSLEALDPREGRWTTLEQMSAPRSSHAAVALGGCLYVAGGQCSSADLLTAPAAAASTSSSAATIGVGPGAAWGWGAPSPYVPVGSPRVLGPYGTSPPTMPHVRVSVGGTGLYGSAPGPGGGWGTAGLGLGPGFPAIGGGAAAVGGSLGGGVGGGGGGEDVTVLSGVECFDVAAGRWRLCAPLSHGGRAGLALCAA